MTDSEQIAAFLATKGATKVAEGEGTKNHWRGRDWARAARGEPTTDDLIRQRRVVVDHVGRERVQNGLGEWIA